jgi:hypothetical protein
MPRLLNFLPCSLATVDALTGNVSLLLVLNSVPPIGLAQGAADAQNEDAAPPTHFVIGPISLFTQWIGDETDQGKAFEQRVVARAPDGKETELQPPTGFVMNRPFHRVLHRVGMSTFRFTGTYLLVVNWREVGRQEWQTAGAYPLVVEDVVIEQPADTPDTLQPPAVTA